METCLSSMDLGFRTYKRGLIFKLSTVVCDINVLLSSYIYKNLVFWASTNRLGFMSTCLRNVAFWKKVSKSWVLPLSKAVQFLPTFFLFNSAKNAPFWNVALSRKTMFITSTWYLILPYVTTTVWSQGCSDIWPYDVVKFSLTESRFNSIL